MQDLVWTTLTAAAEGGAAAEPWYQVVSGILGVPIAVLTLVASIIAIRRSPLEHRKLFNDVAEQQRAAAEERPAEDAAAMAAATSVITAKGAQSIFLRFVALYLVQIVWGVVSTLLNAATLGVQFGISRIEEGVGSDVLIGIVVVLIGSLPVVGYWLLFVYLGWPLLLDTLQLLKVDLPAFVRSERMRWLVAVVAIFAALAQSFAGASFQLFF